MEEIVQDYADNLRNAISVIKSGEFNPQEQIEDINSYRSEERIVGQWLDFDNSLI